MRNVIDRWKGNFAAMNEDDERGDIVQTLLIIVGFVLITAAVIKFLWPVISGKAKQTGDVIDGTTTEGDYTVK